MDFEQQVREEIPNIFTDIPVRVHTKFLVNTDALYILITSKKRYGKGFASISSCLSGLDLDLAVNPIDVLRSKLYRMYSVMKSKIEQESKYVETNLMSGF